MSPLRSMTGFGQAQLDGERLRVVVSVRTVNHRYLEYSLRLPEEFRPLEPKVREILGRYLKRGKVDATLRFHPSCWHGPTARHYPAMVARVPTPVSSITA